MGAHFENIMPILMFNVNFDVTIVWIYEIVCKYALYGTPWYFLMDRRLKFEIQGGKRPLLFITHVLSYGSTFGIKKSDCG
jgi:hypothetical protein